MSFSTGYTFSFAMGVCVVCSLSVASLSLGLRDMQEDNKRRDLQGNILMALGVTDKANPPTGEEIDKLFAERVELRFLSPSGELVDAKDADRDGDGDGDNDDLKFAYKAAKGTGNAPDLLGVYVRKDGSNDGAYAVPANGMGLWGPISGYLALDPGVTEVTGVTFFAPKETPGLGAEIMADGFKDQFVGKKVVDSTGKPTPIQVVKGSAATLCPDNLDHCVDGVSGATITCRGVDAMIAQSLTWYDPYLSKLRGK